MGKLCTENMLKVNQKPLTLTYISNHKNKYKRNTPKVADCKNY